MLFHIRSFLEAYISDSIYDNVPHTHTYIRTRRCARYSRIFCQYCFAPIVCDRDIAYLSTKYLIAVDRARQVWFANTNYRKQAGLWTVRCIIQMLVIIIDQRITFGTHERIPRFATSKLSDIAPIISIATHCDIALSDFRRSVGLSNRWRHILVQRVHAMCYL